MLPIMKLSSSAQEELLVSEMRKAEIGNQLLVSCIFIILTLVGAHTLWNQGFIVQFDFLALLICIGI